MIHSARRQIVISYAPGFHNNAHPGGSLGIQSGKTDSLGIPSPGICNGGAHVQSTTILQSAGRMAW
jgi:hypothetical protein